MFRLYVMLLLVSLAFVITHCNDLGIKELNEIVQEQQEKLQELQSLVLHQQGIINKLTSGKLQIRYPFLTRYRVIIMIAVFLSSKIRVIVEVVSLDRKFP